MKYSTAVGLVCGALILLGGCTVSIQHPIGDPVIDRQSIDLDGAWLVDDQIVFAKQLGDGTIKLAAVGWTEKGFQLEEAEMRLTVDDEAHYIYAPGAPEDYARGEPENDESGYSFYRIVKVEPDGILLMQPDVETFAQAVRERRLEGKVIESGAAINGAPVAREVKVTDTKEAVDAFIHPDRAGEQFEITHPLLIRRVAPLKEESEDSQR